MVVIDEIGTEAEAIAARTISQRGVQLIGTAHGAPAAPLEALKATCFLQPTGLMPALLSDVDY